MKKYFSLVLFTLAALLFTGCSNEEDVTGGTDKADPAGTIGFSFPMNKEGVTYASTPADGNVGVANANESVVTGVRIYMFSTADSKLLAVQSFSAADMVANGGKALFDVTTTSGGATFYAVANADFHIPAASFSTLQIGISTLTDFRKIISNSTGATPLVADPAKGLLMTGFRDVANVLAPTAAEKVINLKRRVARFDVQNLETDGTLDNPTGTNFKISKIYVTKANYSGYISAEVATGGTILTGNINPITYSGTNDGVLNKSVFYLWPTTLDKLQTKTIISIEGTFNGVTQVYKIIPTADISILGNYRYTLKVKRVALNKIDFDIVVDLWNEGQDVTGEQNKTVTTWSVLTNPTTGAAGVFNATMDGTTVNYEGSDATGTAVLSISSTSYRSGATEYSVSNYNGTDNAGTNILVDKSEAVTYAGAAYVTTYKITIPKQTSPVDRKITIADVTDPNNKKEIIIKANPKYLATALRPVLFKGIYWAPVNVGATVADATVLDLASMGNVYQWGRSYASITKATYTDLFAGPVSLLDATTGINKDKFITVSASPYNWFNIDEVAQADALWSGENTQAVCPAGWRLPTDVELKTIKAAWAAANFDATTHRLAVAGDVAGETLYLPAAGHRDRSTGASNFQGTNGRYWSSSVNSGTSYRLFFSETTTDVVASTRAYAYSVRCVQK